MSSNVPQFNLAVPALPGAIFSYFSKDLDRSVIWSPHPDLLSGIRNCLIEAVGRLPRRYQMPPIDGELFVSTAMPHQMSWQQSKNDSPPSAMQLSPITGYSAFSDETSVATDVVEAVAAWQMSICCRSVYRPLTPSRRTEQAQFQTTD
jgi:hypothetical protein